MRRWKRGLFWRGALGSGVVMALLYLPIGRYTAIEQAELLAHGQLLNVIGRGAGKSKFSTDGCSGGISAVWSEVSVQFPELAAQFGRTLPWQACCVAHDRVYHEAGNAQSAQASFEARLEADNALRICVAQMGEGLSAIERDGYQALSQVMYGAVRAAGGPCSGLPWRWGYGYPDCGL